jgi:hypothetical protein
MNQQSIRKAARLAASDIADARSWLSVESRSDGRSRSSCCTPRGYWSLSGCPQVPAQIAKSRSLRTIQMYEWPEPCPIPPCRALLGVDAEELILRLGGRCIDHEQAN